MSEFAPALVVIYEHEGIDSDREADRGGRTRYGISLRFLKSLINDADGDGFMDGDIDNDGDIDADDVAALDRDGAALIYREQWWDRYRYGEITDQDVATKVIDFSINMGPSQAHKCLQRALRACEHRVSVDGVIGPNTRRAANGANPNRLLVALRSEAAGVYRLIVARLPDQIENLNGWLNRAYS